jgi:hypothetical protein
VPYLTSAGFRGWLRHPSNKWASGWDPTPALLRISCDLLLERGAELAGKGTVGDKSPNENDAQAVLWLAAIYPDARLIYIVRDGRDTVLSKRIQAFIDQPESLGAATAASPGVHRRPRTLSQKRTVDLHRGLAGRRRPEMGQCRRKRRRWPAAIWRPICRHPLRGSLRPTVRHDGRAVALPRRRPSRGGR